MTVHTKLILAASAALLATTTACTTDPETGQRRISKAAIGAAIGAGAGFLGGDILGGKSDRTAKIIGTGVGAVAGGAIGAYMDKQEKELRQKTAGTGIEVQRQGDELKLNIPAGVTFATNSAALQPQAQATLDKVAETLSSYNQTYLDVYGHADSQGDEAYNQTLSESRARSVADYLAAHGVARARLATKGFGETQPIAANDTEVGRAQNRRVELRIVPITEQDVKAAS